MLRSLHIPAFFFALFLAIVNVIAQSSDRECTLETAEDLYDYLKDTSLIPRSISDYINYTGGDYGGGYTCFDGATTTSRAECANVSYDTADLLRFNFGKRDENGTKIKDELVCTEVELCAQLNGMVGCLSAETFVWRDSEGDWVDWMTGDYDIDGVEGNYYVEGAAGRRKDMDFGLVIVTVSIILGILIIG